MHDKEKDFRQNGWWRLFYPIRRLNIRKGNKRKKRNGNKEIRGESRGNKNGKQEGGKEKTNYKNKNLEIYQNSLISGASVNAIVHPNEN